MHLTSEQGNALVQQNDSHFLDFKSMRISPAKATQTVSAFANADGGELLIGIEDQKTTGDRWIGFDNEEAANAIVAVLTNLFPPGEIFSYIFITADDVHGTVLRLEALKNRNIWRDSAGDYFARRGAQNIRLDRDGTRELEYSKGLTSFEDEKLDVETDYIIDSSELSSFLKNVVPSAAPEKWLSKQRLVIDGKLTVAGALLFAEEPQALLSESRN